MYRSFIKTGLAVMLTGFVFAADTLRADNIVAFDTEIVSMNLSGGPFPIPLASDPSNQLGDSVEGYGFVDSQVWITLSSMRVVSPGPVSTGRVVATPVDLPPQGDPSNPGPINPSELNGEKFIVDSFFDVFFDITVTDVDSRPGRDYAGQPDGATVMLLDNGPGRIHSQFESIFEQNELNFDLFPQDEENPFLGLVSIEIPLGVDINGNGENDKIKIELATFNILDETLEFVRQPDGTVLATFDLGSTVEGKVVDESTDPPFMLGSTLANGMPDPRVFGGSASINSNLRNSVNPSIPLPAALPAGLALLGFAGLKRRRMA